METLRKSFIRGMVTHAGIQGDAGDHGLSEQHS